MAKKLYKGMKPGAERNRFRPDRIVEFRVTEPAQGTASAPAGVALLDFLIASMPDRRRTGIKELL